MKEYDTLRLSTPLWDNNYVVVGRKTYGKWDAGAEHHNVMNVILNDGWRVVAFVPLYVPGRGTEYHFFLERDADPTDAQPK